MNFKGTIIEESLADVSILENLKILDTRIEKVTDKHKTPWIKHWTLHTVEIYNSRAAQLATEIAKSLDPDHAWYADYKNETLHYIIFREKIFTVNRGKSNEYESAVAYGKSLGIPEYQLDFSPEIK